MKVLAWLGFALMVALMVIPLVPAPSPFITSASAGSCQIAPIARDTLKKGYNFEFDFHVYNSTSGSPLSASTPLSCSFHLYNQTGEHSYFAFLTNDPASLHGVTNEWSRLVSGKNLSSVGSYAYLVQCNSTQFACADKGFFTVTNSGYEATTGRALFDMGILGVLIIFLLGSGILFVYYDSIPIKAGMFGFGYLMLIAITFISWQMASDFLLSAQFLVAVLRILFIALIIGLFPLVIGAFAWYVIMAFKIKQIEGMMKKGISYDEAERRTGGKYK